MDNLDKILEWIEENYEVTDEGESSFYGYGFAYVSVKALKEFIMELKGEVATEQHEEEYPPIPED